MKIDLIHIKKFQNFISKSNQAIEIGGGSLSFINQNVKQILINTVKNNNHFHKFT